MLFFLFGSLGPLLALDSSWAAPGRSWAPVQNLLAGLGAPWPTFDGPSWCKLGSNMPSDGSLAQKYECSKSIRKCKEKHTFLVPRSAQDGQAGAKTEPTWPQDGPRCANMNPNKSKYDPSWNQHGSKMHRMRQHGPTQAPIFKKTSFPCSCPRYLQTLREPK